MPQPANEAWWDDLRQEAEAPPPGPPRAKGPVVAGVVAAAAIVGAVGWWLSTPGGTRFDNPTLQPAPAALPRAASTAADREQVRRAYEQFGLVYANSGVDGLARFSESCAESLRGDPRILDFCLAFDLFAESVRAPGAEPPGEVQARRVALVESALPRGDPDQRISEVRRLMRETTGVGAAAASGGAATAQAAPAAPTPDRTVRPAKAAPAKKPAASDCALRSTPAERLMCAHPTLRVQERRMKAAYERALAAGVDPLVVDRAQAEWRALRNAAGTRGQLADLYARRTRELNEAAAAAAATPVG